MATNLCSRLIFDEILSIRLIPLAKSIGEPQGPGRPPVAADEKRVNISMSVAPATKRLYDKARKKAGKSRGEFLDAVVTTLEGFVI
jgi:hypothetical protein